MRGYYSGLVRWSMAAGAVVLVVGIAVLLRLHYAGVAVQSEWMRWVLKIGLGLTVGVPMAVLIVGGSSKPRGKR